MKKLFFAALLGVATLFIFSCRNHTPVDDQINNEVIQSEHEDEDETPIIIPIVSPTTDSSSSENVSTPTLFEQEARKLFERQEKERADFLKERQALLEKQAREVAELSKKYQKNLDYTGFADVLLSREDFLFLLRSAEECGKLRPRNNAPHGISQMQQGSPYGFSQTH